MEVCRNVGRIPDVGRRHGGKQPSDGDGNVMVNPGRTLGQKLPKGTGKKRDWK